MKKIQFTIFLIFILGILISLLLKPWNVKDNSKELEKRLLQERTIVKEESTDIHDFLSEMKELLPEDAALMSEKSLFSPFRTENEIASDSINKPIDSVTPQFELTGLASYGNVKVATIVIKGGGNTNQSQSTPTAGRGSFRNRQIKAVAKPTAKSSGRRAGQSNIVKVGQEVADTGYELKEIFFGEKQTVITKENERPESSYVILQRGADRITLYLDRNSASSDIRKGAAVAAAKKAEEPKKEAVKEEPKKVTVEEVKREISPPPPPPPPVGMDSATAQRLQELREKNAQRRSEINNRMKTSTENK